MNGRKEAQLVRNIREDFWEAYNWSFERIASELSQIKLNAPTHLKEAISHIEADMAEFRGIERRQDADFGLRVGLRWMSILSKLSLSTRQERLICTFIRDEWIAQGRRGKRPQIIAEAVARYEAEGHGKVGDAEKESLRKDFSKIISRSD